MDKNKIFKEMMIHIPLNTQRYPKNILVIGKEDATIKKELDKYKLNIEFCDENLNIDKTFDTIIDLVGIDRENMNLIYKLLDEEIGIFVTKSKKYANSLDDLKNDLKIVGKNFWIAMPFKFGHTTAILVSHKYHPQSDIILDRSDFIDGYYYNSEIHNCAFVFPNYIFKELTGIAKR